MKEPQKGERLQKVLAARGFGSRRQIEAWIISRKIRINGQIAKLGDRIKLGDYVQIGQQSITLLNSNPKFKHQIIAYNKPEGQIVTKQDPKNRATVFAALPKLKQNRWVSIGRLDLNTSGLLLFTTDGVLAHRLMHPSTAIEREYAVRVLGTVSTEQIQQLTTKVILSDGPARFESVIEAGGLGANHWYKVILKEGRNREVRRLWEAVGVSVSRLIRIRYGNVSLGARLFSGNWRQLEPSEVKGLLAYANMQY